MSNLDIRALLNKLHPDARKAMEQAAGDTVTRTHYNVEVEHFLLALLQPGQEMRDLVTRFELDPEVLQRRLREHLDTLQRGNGRTPALSPLIATLLESAWSAASLNLGAGQITGGAILLALADERLVHVWRETLPDLGRISPAKLRALLQAGPAAAGAGAGAGSAPRPARVFLSYRRSDAEAMALILFYCLLSQIEGIQLFRDSDTLQPGMVYADMIDQTIANCDVVLVLIGKKWLGARHADGRLRLDDADDLVRLEVAAGLRQGKKVFPCLIEGARMPAAGQLPPDLQAMARIHATPLTLSSFARDVMPLVDALQRVGATSRAAG
jgi:hypothetical protein